MWLDLFVAVCSAFFAWIVFPLFGARRSWSPSERSTIKDQLLSERGRLLRALKDLEHEQEAGTIEAGEYAELRTDYLSEAAAVYRRLEEVGVESEGEQG